MDTKSDLIPEKTSFTTRFKRRMSDEWTDFKEDLVEFRGQAAVLFFIEVPILILALILLAVTLFVWFHIYLNYKSWFTISPERNLSIYGWFILGVVSTVLLNEYLSEHGFIHRRLKKVFILSLSEGQKNVLLLSIGVSLIWYFIYLNYQGWLSRFSNPQIPDTKTNLLYLGGLLVLFLIRWAPGNTHLCKFLRRLGLDEERRHDLKMWVYACLFWPLTFVVIGKAVHLGFLIMDVILFYQPSWAEVINHHVDNNQEVIVNTPFLFPYILTALILLFYLTLRLRWRKRGPSQ